MLNLGQKGLTLIKSRQIKGWRSGLLPGGKVKPRVLIEFYHRLAQTLELGLSLVSALDENAKLLPSKPLRKVLEDLRDLESGNTLYEAMSSFPCFFRSWIWPS